VTGHPKSARDQEASEVVVHVNGISIAVANANILKVGASLVFALCRYPRDALRLAIVDARPVGARVAPSKTT
jgi:hypothetical protein